ncbi:hypothetical protein Fcan01_28624 [Folsomia candida]|uniref:Uncharacterized protein n=1 Tax=Folsomia candida TaxID=158441 RepID=A0A226CT04_FOLCA|nr:hypothetical protein Fcan01_28624 [Folsomia candida]
MPPVTVRDSGKGALYALGLQKNPENPKYRNYMKRENLNLVCPAKCHPLQLETPERARFTPLGHSYKSETEHFYDNFKGIRENSEIPKLHEKGKPKSCMSCQMPPVTARDSGKGAFYAPRCGLESHDYKSETEHFCDNFKGIRENSKYRNYMKRENLNLVCPAKCHPLQLETPERARCTPLGHGYKSETEHFCDNFKGIRENCEIKKHENGKPKSCMSCQMPPVTATDSAKGAFYALGHSYKSETEHFSITLKESEKTPKYRNYMKRENLNLVCPAKCHPLQSETPKGRVYAPRPYYKSETEHFYDNFKGIRKTPKYRNYMKRENLNLVCPAKCHPLQLETPERARFTPLGHSYKSETEHFYDNFKGIRENSEIRNYMKRENLNLVCPAKCHPLQLETPERARFTPLGHSYKSETEHFYDNFKGIRENSEIPNNTEKGKPKSCMSCQMPPLQLETPERARFTPLGVDLKVYNQL